MYKYRNEDTVTFYLKPKMAKGIIKWSRFMAIFSLINGGVACATVIGIPLGIVGIIAALKIIRACTDLDSYIKTGRMPYSESAGDNFFGYFNSMKKYYIISIIISAIVVIASVTVLAVFWDTVVDWIEQVFGDLWRDEFPDDGSLPLLISQIGKFFHRA